MKTEVQIKRKIKQMQREADSFKNAMDEEGMAIFEENVFGILMLEWCLR